MAVLCLSCALFAPGCGSSSPSSKAAPVAIGGLPARQGQLLDGGTNAFKRQLAELRGHPVVVNQWASWCGPCAFEFPFFRRLAEKYRGRVAFLGVDSQDNRGEAASFLTRHPVPYPHFFDPDGSIARDIRGIAMPTTVFYDAAGKRSGFHPGAYATEGKLDQDIRKHALDE